MPQTPFGLRTSELFGLRPLGPTLEQTRAMLFGDPTLPKARFDRTSLNIMTPRLSVKTWLGRRAAGRTIPILNLFNHRQPDPAQGFSVRFTDVEDFRGGKLTYDSHNGTDFVIPPGTRVCAAAPGRVCAIRQEFNRGGLKVYLDHGEGLVTTYHHLGRALCHVGDNVRRGEVIALSAYSGADGFFSFPWVAPHVHFNTILDGVQVDPFARHGEVSLWIDENDPHPPTDSQAHDPIHTTSVSVNDVEALLDLLIDERLRSRFSAIDDTTERGFELLVEASTYPTRFSQPGAGARLYGPLDKERFVRRPRLTLPFLAEDFDGIAFADDLGFR